MPYYGGTYVAFFAIEFALYETALREIEHRCEGKSALSTFFNSAYDQIHLLLKVGPETLQELINQTNDVTHAPQLLHLKKKLPKEYGIIDENDDLDL